MGKEEGMRSTRNLVALATAVLVLVIVVGMGHSTLAQEGARVANGAPRAGAPATGAAARGKYIVEDVAYCTNCHTPRFANGQYDRTKWLEGGPLFWQPAHSLPNYPQLVPRLAGTPPANDDEMVTLLTTGVWKDGTKLREPMPQFRLTKEDAQAVVAYLKTLNTTQLIEKR
jgi:mono/diheme cytochrome c family protein